MQVTPDENFSRNFLYNFSEFLYNFNLTFLHFLLEHFSENLF